MKMYWRIGSMAPPYAVIGTKIIYAFNYHKK